jgi:hypothetical protein
MLCRGDRVEIYRLNRSQKVQSERKENLNTTWEGKGWLLLPILAGECWGQCLTFVE